MLKNALRSKDKSKAKHVQQPIIFAAEIFCLKDSISKGLVLSRKALELSMRIRGKEGEFSPVFFWG